MHALVDEDAEGPGEADAVLYLMRHLHRSDSRFLEAFLDRSIAHASPVNAVVVLSRADEIGAARVDALDSARSIAARYAADPQVRALASGVVPIAGLIAETGATLRQEQFGWLRDVATLDEARRTDLLRSVDRFRDRGAEPARRGHSRGAARPARTVRPSAVDPAPRRRGGPDRDRALRRAPRALRDPRAPADPRRALRRAGPGPEGSVGAGGAPRDRAGAGSPWRPGRVGPGRGGGSPRCVVAGPGHAAPPSPRDDRARRRLAAPSAWSSSG